MCIYLFVCQSFIFFFSNFQVALKGMAQFGVNYLFTEIGTSPVGNILLREKKMKTKCIVNLEEPCKINSNPNKCTMSRFCSCIRSAVAAVKGLYVSIVPDLDWISWGEWVCTWESIAGTKIMTLSLSSRMPNSIWRTKKNPTVWKLY